MKRLVPLLLALSLAACASPPAPPSPPQPSQEIPSVPPEPGPDLAWLSSPTLTRDQLRDGLIRLMNGPGPDPAAKLEAVFARLGVRPYGPAALPYAEADLVGDGSMEYIMALPVTDPGRSGYRQGMGAALFVIYRRDGRWEADRSEPMSELAEIELMGPSLNALADLAGTGRPQIVWSRPHMIATGLQPTSFFVTAWKPGNFTHLPGEMAISRTTKDRAQMAIEGKELVLTGGSRGQMFLPTHIDRYRYVDGAFRLVNRHFADAGDTGYARLWDGLVAEDVGRIADAERSYRESADPARKPHLGAVPKYSGPVAQLTPADLNAFGQALRAFARIRLAALLKDKGADAPGAEDGPYKGLIEAMETAPTRKAGCEAAAAWATAHPDFLAAFNRGVSDQPWAPEHLCGHVPLEDTLG